MAWYNGPLTGPLLEKGNSVSAKDISPNGHGLVYLDLFDRDGTRVATKIKERGYSLVTTICFTVSNSYSTHNGCEIVVFHFFESMYVMERKPAQTQEFSCMGFPHSFTKEMLYTIKYFQLYVDVNYSDFGKEFQRGCKLHNLHPELFVADSTHAERKALEEEKAKLFLVKQKLDLMKADLQRERLEFERAKEKHELDQIDLDKYFKPH